MIFNQLACMIERWWPDMIPVVDSAALFHYMVNPHGVLPHSMAESRRAQAVANFRLPAPVTAIEDHASCIILMDKSPGAVGLYLERTFLDCIAIHQPGADDAFADDFEARLDTRELQREAPEGSCVIATGMIEPSQGEPNRWAVTGTLGLVFVGTPEDLFQDPNHYQRGPEHNHTRMLQSCLKNAMTALEEVMHIETLPLFTSWPEDTYYPLAKPTRIRRSSQRTVFRVGADGRTDRTL